MDACGDRFNADLKMGETRRLSFAQLHHDAINSAHLSTGSIEELLVKNTANDVHDQNRMISRGMATSASTNVQSTVTPIIVLLKRVFRCSPT